MRGITAMMQLKTETAVLTNTHTYTELGGRGKKFCERR